jgi:hypothetical protein
MVVYQARPVISHRVLISNQSRNFPKSEIQKYTRKLFTRFKNTLGNFLQSKHGPTAACPNRPYAGQSLMLVYQAWLVINHRAKPNVLSYRSRVEENYFYKSRIQKYTRKLFERNKSSNQRLSLNRSQYGGCSTGYNTLTSNQVVCKWSCAPTLNRSGPALATPQPFSCKAGPYARALAATLPPHRSASRHRGAELSLPWLGGILT